MPSICGFETLCSESASPELRRIIRKDSSRGEGSGTRGGGLCVCGCHRRDTGVPQWVNCTTANMSGLCRTQDPSVLFSSPFIGASAGPLKKPRQASSSQMIYSATFPTVSCFFCHFFSTAASFSSSSPLFFFTRFLRRLRRNSF